MRHLLTIEEKKKGGRNGFRATVEAIQFRYKVNFGTACKLAKQVISQKGISQ